MSEKKNGGLKEFFSMNEVAGYFFRSKEKNRTDNVNLKMMHGINKVSIVMFLLGVIYMVLKNIF